MCKFYRTVITIEIISDEGPVEWDHINDIQYALVNSKSGCTGGIISERVFSITQEEARALIRERKGDPTKVGLEWE